MPINAPVICPIAIPPLMNALSPPLLTPALPGTGGRIKAAPEDFEVEEIPAYEPSGQGEHLYLWVEKRGMGAEFFARQVAQRLGLRPGDVGTAGMKDRHAVTRQWVSVPATAEPQLPQLDGDGVRLLRVSRHANKLKPGHLRGNRFRVLIRDVVPDAMEKAAPILERLRRPDPVARLYVVMAKGGAATAVGPARSSRIPGISVVPTRRILPRT